MFRVVALAACCALATSAAPAAVVVQLDLDHALSGGPPQTNRWHAYATLGDFRNYQISSPSGTITGTGSSAGKNITGFGPFTNYDALETEAGSSGKWRLTLPGATPAQTSVYDLS